jgi:2-methylcitrate dehydratase PrpD
MKSIQNGSDTKETMGWAAMSSVISVELAEKGLTGVTSMLCHQTESLNYLGLDDLGKNFRIFKTYFKQYSACRWTHAPVEAVGILKKHRVFTADEVKRVLVRTHEKAMSCSTVIPANAIQAEYSIPFAVANMIIHDQMGPEQLTAKNLQSSSIQDLAKKIRIEHSSDCEKRFPEKNTAIVVIELLDGTVLESGIVSPRGDYDDPLSMDEIIRKYHWLTGYKWDEEHRDVVLNRILCTVQGKETTLGNFFA